MRIPSILAICGRCTCLIVRYGELFDREAAMMFVILFCTHPVVVFETIAGILYVATSEPFVEWIYNGADIDYSKVVWAREMDPLENLPLRSYFKAVRHGCWSLTRIRPGCRRTKLPERLLWRQPVRAKK